MWASDSGSSRTKRPSSVMGSRLGICGVYRGPVSGSYNGM